MRSCKLHIIFITFFLFGKIGVSQTLFYSDIFHGGVTSNSGSVAFGSGTLNLPVQIPSGSSIKKAYLIASRDSLADDITVKLNGTSYTFNDNTTATIDFIAVIAPLGPLYRPYSNMHIIDITSDVSSSIQNYSLFIPPQPNALKGAYTLFSLYIVFENPSLSKTTIYLYLNNQNVAPITFYKLDSLNPISNTQAVYLGVTTSDICDTTQDGSYVQVNTDTIGLLGGDDLNSHWWTCVGPWANFSYYNQTIYGLDDDTPDAFMEGTDATADIKTYVNNNDTALDLKFIYQTLDNSNGSAYTNPIRTVMLSYTTPCDTFSVNLLTEDTTICQGTSVQLGAFSVNPNAQYEWLPQKDLSCYNCANPVFTGDSSQVYTVRVWNTDSCSKVLPVRVKVLPQPQFTSITLTPTSCGELQGKIVAKSNSTTDSLFLAGNFVGFAPQTLQNMGGGNYTLFLKDTNGCVSKDTSVTINSVNLSNALFTLNPSTGAVPLAVSSDNQSTHATDYMWYFLNDSTTVFAPNMQFDTSGTYTVTLVAYNNIPNCSDTFSLQIIVYDSLQLIIPNVFTPNGDTQNDVFSIQVNAPCTGTITLTNRWGNELFSKNISTDGKQKISLWNGASQGKPVSDGTYFYLLKLQDKQGKGYSFQGFVELVR